MAPARLARTADLRPPAGGSRAKRMPRATTRGRPDGVCGLGHARGGWCARIDTGPSRTPGSPGQQTQQRQTEEQAAAHQHRGVELGASDRIELPDGLERGQGGEGPRAGHGQPHTGHDGQGRAQPSGQRRPSAGDAEGSEGAERSGQALEPLSQALTHQHQKGQGGQPPEYGQGDGLGADGVLNLTVHGAHPSDFEGVAMTDLSGQAPEARLEGWQTGGSPVESDSHPRVGDLPFEAGRGRLGQDGAVRLVELVDERRLGFHDRRDPERGRADRLLGLRVVELVADRAAHAHAEEPGNSRGQGDLVGGRRMGQPPGQHGQGVLAVELAVDTARDRVGEKGVVDMAVHHRVGGYARPRPHWSARRAGAPPGRSAICPGRGC